MASHGSFKESSSSITSTVILSCSKGSTGRNNYAAWVSSVIDTIGTRFGDVATVMKTHVAFVVPEVVPADYMLQDIPGVELTATNQRDLFLKYHMRHQDAVDAIRRESRPFFRCIWATLSEEPRSRVAAQPNFGGPNGWGSTEQPNELWAAIRLTHFTNENAVEGAEMVTMNLLAKQEVFDRFRQKPGVAISDFKRDFLKQVASLEAAGLTADGEPVKALKFLRKLDPARHGAMMIYLQNEAGSGRPYPQTVEDAYRRASTWATAAIQGQPEGAGAGIYMLSDEVKPRATPKPTAAEKNKSGGKTSGSAASEKPSG